MVLQTHAWHNEYGWPYLEEEDPGYLHVSAFFAGMHGMRAFVGKPKLVSNERNLGALGRAEWASRHKLVQIESYYSVYRSCCAPNMFLQGTFERRVGEDRGSQDPLCFTVDPCCCAPYARINLC